MELGPADAALAGWLDQDSSHHPRLEPRRGRAPSAGRFVLAEASGQPDAARFLAAHLFLVRFDQGRLGEVEDRMMEFVASIERDGVVPGILMFRAWLALLLCELDRPDEAIEHYEVLAIANFTGVRQSTSWMITLLPCAAVCAYLSDQARAPVLFDLLMWYAGQIGYTGAGAVGTVAHYLALLATTSGDFDEAERRFANAASTHGRIGAPHWLARTSWSGRGRCSCEPDRATPNGPRNSLG